MLKLSPLLLALLYGFAVYQVSVWRTRRELDARSTELAEPRLRAVCERLARALDLPRIKVHVYEIAPVNGLAAPDGRIFLTRGFLEKFAAGAVTAEEIASVVAHELGHVALGHSRRRMVDFSAQNALRTALAAVLSRLIPGIGGMIAAGLTRLVAAGISRSDEYEADAYASALMIKAGFGTGPQKSLLSKLDSMAGAHGATPAWLMSHPKTAARIEAIAANEKKWLGA
ncbi:putative metalloprotease [Limimaricola variabilis]|jgi:putative metalloprotease|uniref:Metalloprotease n=1 Tax=Limimaricola variabilis TaxID=1492771 RepID=A0ABR6HJ42_9RHOB|nr:M48 family metallopeptidase [Limimaricola variabilis]MBB3710575.1 putative metalloprotease [Limimaricola variabilis]WPY95115.1 M48 family metallopeptidase [Limimaricola variabilis]